MGGLCHEGPYGCSGLCCCWISGDILSRHGTTLSFLPRQEIDALGHSTVLVQPILRISVRNWSLQICLSSAHDVHQFCFDRFHCCFPVCSFLWVLEQRDEKAEEKVLGTAEAWGMEFLNRLEIAVSCQWCSGLGWVGTASSWLVCLVIQAPLWYVPL